MSSIQVLVTLVDGETGKILFDGQVATIPLDFTINVGNATNAVLLNEVYKRLGVIGAAATSTENQGSAE